MYIIIYGLRITPIFYVINKTLIEPYNPQVPDCTFPSPKSNLTNELQPTTNKYCWKFLYKQISAPIFILKLPIHPKDDPVHTLNKLRKISAW